MIPTPLTLHAVAPIGAASGSCTPTLYEVLGLPRGQDALIQKDVDGWRILRPEGPRGPWRAWSDCSETPDDALAVLGVIRAFRQEIGGSG